MDKINNQRSFLHLTTFDIIIGMTTSILIGVSRYFVLWNGKPWSYTATGEIPGWFVKSRSMLFIVCGFMMSWIGAFSAISLVHWVRLKDTQHFSRLNYFGITWPLFNYPLLIWALENFKSSWWIRSFVVSLFLLAVMLIIKGPTLGRWLSVIWIIVWNMICFYFLVGWIGLFWD